ncbi:MAG: hypothetical protein V4683_03705 [Bacteroidota bacterium]
MKNQIKPIIAALLLGTVFFANAKTLPANPTIKPFASSMYKINGVQAINLFVNKLEGSKVKIVLKDTDGTVIYRDVIGKKRTKFRTKFNMDQLKTGSYTLELTDGNSTEIKNIEI